MDSAVTLARTHWVRGNLEGRLHEEDKVEGSYLWGEWGRWSTWVRRMGNSLDIMQVLPLFSFSSLTWRAEDCVPDARRWPPEQGPWSSMCGDSDSRPSFSYKAHWRSPAEERCSGVQQNFPRFLFTTKPPFCGDGGDEGYGLRNIGLGVFPALKPVM